MATVYVLRYSHSYCEGESIQVYSNLRGVLNRMEMMDLYDNFDQDETVTIECMEITSEEKSLETLNNVRTAKALSTRQ